MNVVLQQNIRDFTQSFELSHRLSHSRFLITGCTGLIGSILAHSLLAIKQDIDIIAPVRNIKKGVDLFDEAELKNIHFIECDLSQFDYSEIGTIDYIVHCAAPTSSQFFVEHPVETFDIIYQATRNLLEFSRKSEVKSFVYLSSLEVSTSAYHFLPFSRGGNSNCKSP